MLAEDTALPGVNILMPRCHGDARGFFSESRNKQVMAVAGLDYELVQDNHSVPARVDTLRGLHFRRPPHAQARLIRCGAGRLYTMWRWISGQAFPPVASGSG